MFQTLDISASALDAYRTRMDVIANNVANVNTTRDAFGRSAPYRRAVAMMAQGAPGLCGEGVRVSAVVGDPAPFRKVYDPSNPDAVQAGEDKGYVFYPNVNMSIEIVDMVAATRIYEANIAAFEAAKTMIGSALRILA